jgi:Carboxypeptidase activation peptide
VKAISQSQAEALSLWHDRTGIDFWDVLRPDKYSRILVAPEQQEPFDLFLEEHTIDASIVNDDVEE